MTTPAQHMITERDTRPKRTARVPVAHRGLRILWVSHFVPYPPSGGALQRTHHLLRQAARRHEIHLAALNQRAILPGREAVADAARQLSEFCAGVNVFPMVWDRSPLHRFVVAVGSFVHPAPYDVNWLTSPAMRRWLGALAGTRTFDLIHVDILGLIPFVDAFSAIPIALNHHNVESQLVRRRAQKETRGLHRLYLQREAAKLEAWERRVCPRVAVNLAVSDLDAVRLREVVGAAGAARTVVVENGVDVDYFRPGASGRSDTGGLVFAGSLSWYANRDAVRYFLTEIWPALVAGDARRRMTFVGRDPPPELLAAGASDRRIAVTGPVPDVRPYLDAAAIYVCPIRDGGGTRLKILDALAMAKPLVATALAVEGFGLTEGEHFLRAETPPEFVAQVGRLERDAGLRRRLGEAGRALVARHYAWDAIGRKLDHAYRAAAGVADGEE